MKRHNLKYDEFISSLRQRDIVLAFEEFYRKKSKEDPDAWPLELNEGEWQDAFLDFLTDEWGLRT